MVNYVLSQGGAGPASPSPAQPGGPPPPVFPVVTLPTILFTARLPNYAIPADFDAQARAAYMATIAGAVTASVPTRVLITDVRQGSAIVDTMVLFLVRLSGPTVCFPLFCDDRTASPFGYPTALLCCPGLQRQYRRCQGPAVHAGKSAWKRVPCCHLG